MLQQPIAPLEGVSAHALFEYVLQHSQGNERTGEQTSQQLLDPFPLDSVVQQKWRCFGPIFEISPGHRKPRIFIYLFFAEVLQITSRFVLARKHFGVRCTLNWIYTLSCLKQPLSCLNPNDIFHDCEEKFDELICDNKETLLSSHQVRSPSYIVMFWLPV